MIEFDYLKKVHKMNDCTVVAFLLHVHIVQLLDNNESQIIMVILVHKNK